MGPVMQRSEVQADAMTRRRPEVGTGLECVQESLFDWPVVKKKKKSGWWEMWS